MNIENIYYVVHNDDTVEYIQAECKEDALKIAELFAQHAGTEVFAIKPCCFQSSPIENHEPILFHNHNSLVDQFGEAHELINESRV
jgi:hypothetical protein